MRGRTDRRGRHVEQIETLRSKQLDHVRRANRALEAAAEPDVLDRRPVHPYLVGVGRQLVVVRVAIGHVQVQLIGEWGILHQRDPQLGEVVRHPGAAVQGGDGAALATDGLRLQQQVGHELHPIRAALDADGASGASPANGLCSPIPPRSPVTVAV